jgi:hypothetical protein
MIHSKTDPHFVSFDNFDSFVSFVSIAQMWVAVVARLRKQQRSAAKLRLMSLRKPAESHDCNLDTANNEPCCGLTFYAAAVNAGTLDRMNRIYRMVNFGVSLLGRR